MSAQWGSEQWVATTEDGVTWKQIEENPVIAMSDSPEVSLSEWRESLLSFNGKGRNTHLWLEL